MEELTRVPLTADINTTQNTTIPEPDRPESQKWEFLVVVLVVVVFVLALFAVLAKCQVVRRYLASYRHTRLRETEAVSQPSGLDVEFTLHHAGQCRPPVREEDDDGFIEDNYIQPSDQERARRAAEVLRDSEDEMDDIDFSIA